MKDILFKFFKFLMLFYMAFAWVLFIVVTIILYIILSPFIIDGVTYGAFIDPDDGYRSYGSIQEVKDHKCQYTFPPQPVNIQNVNINKEVYREDKFGGWHEYISKDFLRMTDAVNGKEVLEIGTDYSEDYYPCAIFHYTPENLEINKNR